MSFLLALPVDEGLKLIVVAVEEHAREIRFQHWLHGGYAQQISFNEYLSRIEMEARASKETTEEILAKLAAIF